jgi:hypothetical protein
MTKRHRKHNRIKRMLGEGLTVRQVAKALHVSSKTVSDIRAMYPDDFEPNKPRPKLATIEKKEATRSVSTRLRLSGLYAQFRLEMDKRRLSTSELLRSILSERYRCMSRCQCDCKGHDNPWKVQTDCDCPPGSMIKNYNSHRDGDNFVCCLCGRVENGEE